MLNLTRNADLTLTAKSLIIETARVIRVAHHLSLSFVLLTRHLLAWFSEIAIVYLFSDVIRCYSIILRLFSSSGPGSLPDSQSNWQRQLWQGKKNRFVSKDSSVRAWGSHDLTRIINRVSICCFLNFECRISGKRLHSGEKIPPVFQYSRFPHWMEEVHSGQTSCQWWGYWM